VLIALCSAALVFLVWYPTPLEEAAGVTHIFLMLLAVDVVLGPCITLIIFNPAKKELKYDLTIVLLIQLAALFYGLYSVFEARPVYIVYIGNRFDLVYANDLTEKKLAKVSNPLFKSPPLGQPEIIAITQPTDEKTRTDIMFSAISGGDDLPQLPQYYVSYGEKKSEAIKKLQPIEKLRELNPDNLEKVIALTQKYAAKATGIGFIPLKGKVKHAAVIISKDTGDVLEITALKPW
jgi:hypothetical protein